MRHAIAIRRREEGRKKRERKAFKSRGEFKRGTSGPGNEREKEKKTRYDMI